MADDEEWDSEMPDAEESSLGMTKSVLKKARALNPALAAQGSTTDLFNKLKGKQKKDGAPPPANAKVDLVTHFVTIRDAHAKERQRLDDAIAKLQAEKNALPNKTFDALLALIEQADPNMTSPQTKELLRSEARFLESVGFSMKRVVERRKKR